MGQQYDNDGRLRGSKGSRDGGKFAKDSAAADPGFDLKPVQPPKPAPPKERTVVNVPPQLSHRGPNRKPRAFVKGDFLTFSEHAKDQMRKKGFTQAQGYDALMRPYKITESRAYHRQWRFCGRGPDGQPGIAVIVDFSGPKPEVVTAYLDGVVTAQREDQKNDPRAQNSRRLARAA